ncbi:hypothetical protein Tco_1437423 [Tanacetum coccineum]
MVPNEEDRVERFIGGLPDNIQGNVIAANPARFQDAVRIANQLMDKKLQGYATRSTESKRRMESNSRDNRGQQSPFKRQNISGQNVVRAYTTVLGWLLEEINVTWAHLEKKWTRLQLYTKSDKENVYSGWRRRHNHM